MVIADVRARCLIACWLVACGPTPTHHGDGGGDDGSNNQPHTLVAISVMPTNAIVELDLNMTGTQPYVAIGNYADGTTEDLTAMATWTVANPAVGAMNGTTLQIPAFTASNAVTSKITASFGGFDGPAQITVVAYRKSGTQLDFFFVLPYQDPMGPAMKPLDFSTGIPSLDVFFLMDTTGSMGGEIRNLQSSLNSTVTPGIRAAIPDSQFGVGAFDDFPVSVYGSFCGAGDGTYDQPFKLRQPITSNLTSVQTAVNGLTTATGATIGCGGDTPEAGIEAIYQAATGEGLTGPSPTSVPANHTGVGGVGYRSGTMPVVVAITDAPSHGPGETTTCAGSTGPYANPVAAVAHSRAQAKTALANICARAVGIAAVNTADPSCSGEAYLQDLATATGARVAPSAWDVGTRPAGCGPTQCCTDFNGVGRAPDAQGLCPMVFRVDISGNGVGTSVATGIQMLTRFATFNVPTDRSGVTTDINGNPLPAPHTTADFLKSIAPTSFVLPPPPPVVPAPTFDATTFYGVTPGTKITFTVDAFNDFVMQTNDAQIFRATIRVTASGCTPLDQRDVLILVPPQPIVLQKPSR